MVKMNELNNYLEAIGGFNNPIGTAFCEALADMPSVLEEYKLEDIEDAYYAITLSLHNNNIIKKVIKGAMEENNFVCDTCKDSKYDEDRELYKTCLISGKILEKVYSRLCLRELLHECEAKERIAKRTETN